MKAINHFFDHRIHPKIRLLYWHLPAFQAFGSTGLVLAIGTTIALVVFLGLSPWIMIGLICLSMLTFLGLAMVTKIMTGEEQLIYYHHEIAIMIVAALFLKIICQPVLPYLDITVLGIGAFLVCGRIGCLMVGCCHGRPHQWGVCYCHEHVDAGFTPYYEGVRLFPIQAVESVWVLFIVATGSILVLTTRLPGEALAWYVVNYDIGRFIFEFARGDAERPYYGGFSQGQWISVFLMGAVAVGEVAGMLPFHQWHIFTTAGIVLTMICLALARQFRGKGRHQLLNPRHVREIAEAIALISSRVCERTVIAGGYAMPKEIPLAFTSLGIRISTGKIKDANRLIEHYALSSQNGTMGEEAARSLADLIIQMKQHSSVNRLVDGGNGVFHLLIHPFGAGDQG